MDTDQRRLLVFETIKRQREVSVQALIEAFGVSGMTIRRDLAVLEAQRLIRRDYGKAVWIAEDYFQTVSFEARRVAHREAKKRIAQLAAQLMPEMNSLFIDGSSTCGELARCLPADRRLTVYTNNLAAVQFLRALPKVRTFVLGGYVTEDRNALDGELTLGIARGVYVDATFVSCSGFSTRGVVNNGLSETRLKTVMMGNATRTFLLADHSKWNAKGLFEVGGWERIDTFVTDQRIDPALQAVLQAKQVDARWTLEAEAYKPREHHGRGVG